MQDYACVYQLFVLISLLNLPDIGYIRMDRERVVCVIHNKAGCGPVWLFDIFLLQVVNLDLVGIFALGVVASELACLLKGFIGQLFVFCLNYDM